MEKTQILDAIRRIAARNGGKAPGSQRFKTETGVGKADWYPKYWLRWGDAVREAGCAPNALSASFSDDFLIQKYIELTRELGRFPIEGDLMVKRRSDTTFPNREAFARLGNKGERVAKVLEFCRRHDEFADAISMVVAAVPRPSPIDEVVTDKPTIGYVYLLRHGTRREYKIGRTINVLRREGEIRIELPNEVTPIHVVKTDDPSGVEEYWHRRFAANRLRNEWFALTAADVQAFKRWKRIV